MKKTISSIIALIIISAVMLTNVSFLHAAAAELDNIDKTTSLYKSSENILEVPISERYHIIENGYREKYDLQEGIYGFQSALQVNRSSVYFYSDGYFEDMPEIYNPSLSSMSFALAFSAFNAKQNSFDYSLPNGSYSNLFRHVKLLISDIGIEEKNIYINEGYANRPSQQTIGVIMGSKEISLDEGYILLPIVVRGGDYETEWASNFTLGEEGEALGFSSAAAQVVSEVEKYIDSYSTFDISSALDKGKVKFWVVGYSRGGAVANITAKRLTDKYGESGNSVYSYSFEAPSGGVDSAEIKENWTYNGVYANIHNVINTGDLVPRIPPKQMGFKRYGVDHYMPGTEAGEIITSIYTTPTGISVTTYADNEPYIVGDIDYLARRPEMLRHLSTIDSTVTFSDSFAIGKIDFMSALAGGELFVPIDEGKSITAAQWLDAFISDLQNWAANGTYSDGSLEGDYFNDFREFYTTNIEFAGEEYVSIETALRCILDMVYTNYYDINFANDILFRFASLLLEDFNLLDMYFNPIQRWDKLSQSKQREYLDKIWGCLTEDMQYSDGRSVKKITDFVDPENVALLEDSVYTFSAFLFLFVTSDFNKSPEFDTVKQAQIHLITLIANGMTVVQGHFPEVCSAWLRTYDENYSQSNESSKLLGKEIKLINDENNLPPNIEMELCVENGKTTVALKSVIGSSMGVDAGSENNGSAIYFALFENGKMVDNWRLYRAPIVIDTTKDTKYTVKAFALRLEEMSAELEITDAQIRTKPALPDTDGGNTVPDGTVENEPPQNVEASEPLQDIEQIKALILIISGGILLMFAIVFAIFISKKRKKAKRNKPD